MKSYTKGELDAVRKLRDAVSAVFELAEAMSPELREDIGFYRNVERAIDFLEHTAHSLLYNSGAPLELPLPDSALASTLSSALRTAAFPAEIKDWGAE